MQKDVTFGNSTLPPAQIPCPCGEKILVPVEAILQLRGATCWNCSARLEIDGEANRSALSALAKITQKIDSLRRDAVS